MQYTRGYLSPISCPDKHVLYILCGKVSGPCTYSTVSSHTVRGHSDPFVRFSFCNSRHCSSSTVVLHHYLIAASVIFQEANYIEFWPCLPFDILVNKYCIGHKEPRAASLPWRPEEIKIWEIKDVNVHMNVMYMYNRCACYCCVYTK